MEGGDQEETLILIAYTRIATAPSSKVSVFGVLVVL